MLADAIPMLFDVVVRRLTDSSGKNSQLIRVHEPCRQALAYRDRCPRSLCLSGLTGSARRMSKTTRMTRCGRT